MVSKQLLIQLFREAERCNDYDYMLEIAWEFDRAFGESIFQYL